MSFICRLISWKFEQPTSLAMFWDCFVGHSVVLMGDNRAVVAYVSNLVITVSLHLSVGKADV